MVVVPWKSHHDPVVTSWRFITHYTGHCTISPEVVAPNMFYYNKRTAAGFLEVYQKRLLYWKCHETLIQSPIEVSLNLYSSDKMATCLALLAR